MPAPPTTRARSPLGSGLAWGLTAAAIWTVYSVLARLGIKSGLSPLDMTLLRFAPGAVVMLPFLWRWGVRDMAGIGWRRGVVLAALSGPVFSLLMMTGFAHAPLAHGAVIAPACQMLAGIGFSAWLARAPVTRETLFGAGFVLLGLGFMGSDALLHAEGSSVALGDVLFAAAGASFGLFGALSRRWLVDPVRVTGVAVDDDVVRAGAVVVTTGGFGANPALWQEHLPSLAAAGGSAWYIGAPGAQGDAAKNSLAPRRGTRLVPRRGVSRFALGGARQGCTPASGSLEEGLPGRRRHGRLPAAACR